MLTVISDGWIVKRKYLVSRPANIATDRCMLTREQFSDPTCAGVTYFVQLQRDGEEVVLFKEPADSSLKERYNSGGVEIELE